jgi:hypothetical protein
MNAKLRQVITSPMRTILAVRACFDYCENEEDINQVIKKIPPKFGKFELLAVFEKENYFQIQNLFEKGGEIHSQIVSHDFYNVKEDYYYDFGRKA